MKPKTTKNILIFAVIIQIFVFLVNTIFILRVSSYLDVFQPLIKLLLQYSGIILVAGYCLYVVAFCLLILFYKTSSSLKHLLYIFIVSSFGVIAIWIYYIFLEKMNYPNYVFSTYDIYLPSLDVYAVFHTSLLIGGYFIFWYFKSRHLNFFKHFFVPMLTVILFAITFLRSVEKVAGIVSSETRFISQYISSGGEVENTPDFIPLKRWSKFIIFSTEENSTIIHPKQSEAYPVIGNQPLIRYFLHPRTLVSTSFADEYLRNNEDDSVYFLLKKAQNNSDEYFPNKLLQSGLDIETVYILLTNGTIRKYDSGVILSDLGEIYNLIDVGIIKIK